LLDLPIELRLTIFELVLIAEEPIEFTPHPLDWDEQLGRLRWYAVRKYARSMSTALGLLRVSRAVREKTAPIFYGQEFRFSSTFGWPMLYRFLLTIGRWNRQHLQNLTVHIPFEHHEDVPRITKFSKTNLGILSRKLGLIEPGYCGGDHYPHQQAIVRVCGRMLLGGCTKLRTLNLVFFDDEKVWNGARILPNEEPLYEAMLQLRNDNYKPRPYPMKGAYPVWAMIQRLSLRNKRLQIGLIHVRRCEELSDDDVFWSGNEDELDQTLESEEQKGLVAEARKRGWTVRCMYYYDEGYYPASRDI
jgi:hypothetical protein